MGTDPSTRSSCGLSPGEHGDTILELEHASVSDLAPDGSTSAVLGVGVGWEMALDYLGKFLRRELPSTQGQGTYAAGLRADTGGHLAREPARPDLGCSGRGRGHRTPPRYGLHPEQAPSDEHLPVPDVRVVFGPAGGS